VVNLSDSSACEEVLTVASTDGTCVEAVSSGVSDSITASVPADKSACEAVDALTSAEACRGLYTKASFADDVTQVKATCVEKAWNPNRNPNPSIRSDKENCEAVTGENLDNSVDCEAVKKSTAVCVETSGTYGTCKEKASVSIEGDEKACAGVSGEHLKTSNSCEEILTINTNDDDAKACTYTDKQSVTLDNTKCQKASGQPKAACLAMKTEASTTADVKGTIPDVDACTYIESPFTEPACKYTPLNSIPDVHACTYTPPAVNQATAEAKACVYSAFSPVCKERAAEDKALCEGVSPEDLANSVACRAVSATVATCTETAVASDGTDKAKCAEVTGTDLLTSIACKNVMMAANDQEAACTYTYSTRACTYKPDVDVGSTFTATGFGQGQGEAIKTFSSASLVPNTEYSVAKLSSRLGSVGGTTIAAYAGRTNFLTVGGATCSETATESTRADKASCETITDLKTPAACGAVITEASKADTEIVDISACTYTLLSTTGGKCVAIVPADSEACGSGMATCQPTTTAEANLYAGTQTECEESAGTCSTPGTGDTVSKADCPGTYTTTAVYTAGPAANTATDEQKICLASQATCTETAVASDVTDKAACAAVTGTDLLTSIACKNVMMVANDQEAACTYSNIHTCMYVPNFVGQTFTASGSEARSWDDTGSGIDLVYNVPVDDVAACEYTADTGKCLPATDTHLMQCKTAKDGYFLEATHWRAVRAGNEAMCKAAGVGGTACEDTTLHCPCENNDATPCTCGCEVNTTGECVAKGTAFDGRNVYMYATKAQECAPVENALEQYIAATCVEKAATDRQACRGVTGAALDSGAACGAVITTPTPTCTPKDACVSDAVARCADAEHTQNACEAVITANTATCVEKAQVSVPDDKASCGDVGNDQRADCEAVMTAASKLGICAETAGTGSGTDHDACKAVQNLAGSAACLEILTDSSADNEYDGKACTYTAPVKVAACTWTVPATGRLCAFDDGISASVAACTYTPKMTAPKVTCNTAFDSVPVECDYNYYKTTSPCHFFGPDYKACKSLSGAQQIKCIPENEKCEVGTTPLVAGGAKTKEVCLPCTKVDVFFKPDCQRTRPALAGKRSEEKCNIGQLVTDIAALGVDIDSRNYATCLSYHTSQGGQDTKLAPLSGTFGCTDARALNFNQGNQLDDGSCIYADDNTCSVVRNRCTSTTHVGDTARCAAVTSLASSAACLAVETIAGVCQPKAAVDAAVCEAATTKVACAAVKSAATCTETVGNSDNTDKAACAGVSGQDLKTSAVCLAVPTSASGDGDTKACKYVAKAELCTSETFTAACAYSEPGTCVPSACKDGTFSGACKGLEGACRGAKSAEACGLVQNESKEPMCDFISSAVLATIGKEIAANKNTVDECQLELIKNELKSTNERINACAAGKRGFMVATVSEAGTFTCYKSCEDQTDVDGVQDIDQASLVGGCTIDRGAFTVEMCYGAHAGAPEAIKICLESLLRMRYPATCTKTAQISNAAAQASCDEVSGGALDTASACEEKNVCTYARDVGAQVDGVSKLAGEMEAVAKMELQLRCSDGKDNEKVAPANAITSATCTEKVITDNGGTTCSDVVSLATKAECEANAACIYGPVSGTWREMLDEALAEYGDGNVDCSDSLCADFCEAGVSPQTVAPGTLTADCSLHSALDKLKDMQNMQVGTGGSVVAKAAPPGKCVETRATFGTCTQTASGGADTAKCAAVIGDALKTSTACAAVTTAAGVAACTYAAPSSIQADAELCAAVSAKDLLKDAVCKAVSAADGSEICTYVGYERLTRECVDPITNVDSGGHAHVATVAGVCVEAVDEADSVSVDKDNCAQVDAPAADLMSQDAAPKVVCEQGDLRCACELVITDATGISKDPNVCYPKRDTHNNKCIAKGSADDAACAAVTAAELDTAAACTAILTVSSTDDDAKACTWVAPCAVTSSQLCELDKCNWGAKITDVKACKYVAPTADSDGIDNDGDGLVDCEDPDCITKKCYPLLSYKKLAEAELEYTTATKEQRNAQNFRITTADWFSATSACSSLATMDATRQYACDLEGYYDETYTLAPALPKCGIADVRINEVSGFVEVYNSGRACDLTGFELHLSSGDSPLSAVDFPLAACSGALSTLRCRLDGSFNAVNERGYFIAYDQELDLSRRSDSIHLCSSLHAAAESDDGALQESYDTNCRKYQLKNPARCDSTDKNECIQPIAATCAESERCIYIAAYDPEGYSKCFTYDTGEMFACAETKGEANGASVGSQTVATAQGRRRLARERASVPLVRRQQCVDDGNFTIATGGRTFSCSDIQSLAAAGEFPSVRYDGSTPDCFAWAPAVCEEGDGECNARQAEETKLRTSCPRACLLCAGAAADLRPKGWLQRLGDAFVQLAS
jgi:hypothetical protein